MHYCNYVCMYVYRAATVLYLIQMAKRILDILAIQAVQSRLDRGRQ